jgi:septal ring factor EnvC (AmiA/AmiB activator)
MWKQFLELIPHLSRLLPHIDRLIQQRAGNDDVQKKNLEQFQQMTEGLRSDLAQATASHASLYRQLNEQGEKMSTLAADLHDSRTALQSAETRIAKLEALVIGNRKLIAVTMVVVMMTFALIVVRSSPLFTHH